MSRGLMTARRVVPPHEVATLGFWGPRMLPRKWGNAPACSLQWEFA
jgi:hypothetical protein